MSIEQKERIVKALGSIIQRCCEPIDDLRSSACSAIGLLLQNKTIKQLKIPDFDLLENIFLFNNNKFLNFAEKNQDYDNFKEIDWMHAKGFLRLMLFLGSSAYHLNALEGFVLSAGRYMTALKLFKIVFFR